ncbi:ABC-three component system middle component 2 [Enterocloster clostridioformis]|uniref:ABC-three component system middle component 2 n=1 Tax=Enterocloster clostridioformis TaxID=1531 RepID=UPI0034A0DBB8
MTTGKPFNSTLENALRVLLLLNVCEMPKTADLICAVDFMTQYGKEFGISDRNLNGENPYKFSEFISKRELIWEALKYLVLHELAQPLSLEDGMEYIITPQGEGYCNLLSSEYAAEYSAVARRALEVVGKFDERKIISAINQLSAERVEG